MLRMAKLTGGKLHRSPGRAPGRAVRVACSAAVLLLAVAEGAQARARARGVRGGARLEAGERVATELPSTSQSTLGFT